MKYILKGDYGRVWYFNQKNKRKGYNVEIKNIYNKFGDED
jgi:hypothetical protein